MSKLTEKLIENVLASAQESINAIVASVDKIDEAERLMQHLCAFGATERGIRCLSYGRVVIFYHEDAEAMMRDLDAAAILIERIENYGGADSKAIILEGWHTVLEVEMSALDAFHAKAAA